MALVVDMRPPGCLRFGEPLLLSRIESVVESKVQVAKSTR